jgi:hypothetical protein
VQGTYIYSKVFVIALFFETHVNNGQLIFEMVYKRSSYKAALGTLLSMSRNLFLAITIASFFKLFLADFWLSVKDEFTK